MNTKNRTHTYHHMIQLDYWASQIVHRSHRADSASDEISPNKDKEKVQLELTPFEFTVQCNVATT